MGARRGPVAQSIGGGDGVSTHFSGVSGGGETGAGKPVVRAGVFVQVRGERVAVVRAGRSGKGDRGARAAGAVDVLRGAGSGKAAGLFGAGGGGGRAARGA